jgi:putative transposase
MITVKEVKLEEVLNQVFENLRSEFLLMFKSALEKYLDHLREQAIGTGRYVRGNIRKRWGFTVRKSILTTIGRLENVRIPRLRNAVHEVRLWTDRFTSRMGQINEILLEQFLWGLSARKSSSIMEQLFGEKLSAASICCLQERLSEKVNQIQKRPLNQAWPIIVVDGVWGKCRGRGKAVCLIAIGVDAQGRATLLDWLGCESEDINNYLRLFRRLQQRGLSKPEMIVSDGIAAISQVIQTIWGHTVVHQLCLWHMAQLLSRHLEHRNFWKIKEFRRDYWHVFEALDAKEAYDRSQVFIEHWRRREPQAIGLFRQHWPELTHYYQYPLNWNYRVRTTNLAEGFFSHLQTFLKRFPGWNDENHIMRIVGIFTLGMKVFQQRNNRDTLHFPQLNFNRIY